MATVAGTRASLSFFSSCSAAAAACSSPRQHLLSLPRPCRSYLSLASAQAAASRARNTRKRRFLVRAARMESTGVAIGFRAPQFELPEPLTGQLWTLDDFEGNPAMLVMFICNHCPFVKHLKKDIAKLTSFYMKKGLGAVAISSNSMVTHPQDGPDHMAEEAKLFKYPFPYLYDESQEVAKDFGAVCTPEFFLFKKDGRRPFELFYHAKLLDGTGTRDNPHPTQDAPEPSRRPPRRGRRRFFLPPAGGPATPTQRAAGARAPVVARPFVGVLGQQQRQQPPRLLLGSGLWQGGGRGEPQVRGGAGGDRGGHGQQGDGLLQRGGHHRARGRWRGARRLRRAPRAPPARRRRRAPPIHGAQDGAAQGGAQAARGLG